MPAHIPQPEHSKIPQPTSASRRTLLSAALCQAGVVSAAPLSAGAQDLLVENVTRLYGVRVARVAVPTSAKEVAEHIQQWPGQVAVGGGRFSMGGQVAIEGGLHLDMRQMNQLLWLNSATRTARVQAGMRWRDLQDHLDPLGLAVKTMQSFSNFTVGGAVSVNAHGRYVGHGPMGHSVRALQMVLADGRIVETSRTQEPELFSAALGGYGALGVVTEVELELAQNVRIAREVSEVALEDYVRHFQEEVLEDPDAFMHNADLLAPDFDAPICVTWRKAPAGAALTDETRLTPRGSRYRSEQNAIWAMTELPGGAQLRRVLTRELLGNKPAVVWLNREASLDVARLEPRTRAMSTYVLQEYFVPAHQLVPFVRAMANILKTNRVEALNVSLRHAPRDRDGLMAWAPQEVFSLVLYYKQRTWAAAQRTVGQWTQELIDAVLAHEGRYYLPYQLHATQAQFDAAYPQAQSLRALKLLMDPQNKFSNELWRKYL